MTFKFKLSYFIIILMTGIWIWTMLVQKIWKTEQGVISSDVSVYYEYLPAVLIYHDLSLGFKNDPEFLLQDKFWAHYLPNQKFVIKMSMGLSLLYLPFFMIAHLFCLVTGQPADGFSDPYELMLLVGSIFYAVTGFVFLRKLLRLYFNEEVVSLCLLVIGLGTNFFIYVTREACMSHVYLFCMFNIFVWYVHIWYREKSLGSSLILGLTGGIITLIRPTNVLIALVFILYDVKYFKDLKARFILFLNFKKQLMVILILILIVWAPQVVYWKIQTGQWLFFSYVGERFFFNHPHLFDGFFSYRKGWLLYSPLMIFSLLGFFSMRKQASSYFAGILLFFILSVYVILSWWCWWYGGGFGQRAFIDMYGLLALPMGCFFAWIFTMKIWKKTVFVCLVLVLICFQLFQSYQYHTGSIHWDSMTREAYRASFLKVHPPPGWHYLLKEPDYKGAKENGREGPE